MLYSFLKPSYFFYLLVVIWILLFGGCISVSGSEFAYKQISTGTLKAGDPIPQPRQDILLTVTGKIGQTNSDGAIIMDLSTIESLGVIEYEVEDPFEGEKAIYRGVLMEDLLELWQIDEDATTLKVSALNDYSAEMPIPLLQEYPVMFALQQNGQYMQPSYRGPAMLVFPYDQYEFERPLTDNYWVWQIKAIEVK